MVKTYAPPLRHNRAKQGSHNTPTSRETNHNLQGDEFPFDFYNDGALYIPRRAPPEEVPSTSASAVPEEVPSVVAIPNVAPVTSVEANIQWRSPDSVPSAAAMPLPEPVTPTGENVEKTESIQDYGDDSSHASYSHESENVFRFDGPHQSSVATEEDDSSIDSSEESSDDSELLIESNKSSKRNRQDGKSQQEALDAVIHPSKRPKISKNRIATWNRRLEELREFKSEHGHCRVPCGEFKPLRDWLWNQSTRYLDPKDPKCINDLAERERRTKELESVLGTDLKSSKKKIVHGQFDRLRLQWDQRLEELKAFKSVHGHCAVPKTSGPLYVWLKDQTQRFLNPNHANCINDVAERARRTKELESVLGTDLESWRKTIMQGHKFDGSGWDRHLEDLKEFKSVHGHCAVPRSSLQLCDWLKYQCTTRLNLKHAKCINDVAERERRTRELELVLGTDLESFGKTHAIKNSYNQVYETQWDQHLEELKEFKSSHGHCRVSTKSGPVYHWLANQSQIFLNPKHASCLKVASERKRRTKELEAVLGTDVKSWSKNYSRGNRCEGARWDQHLQELKEFKSVHGHCKVPTSSGKLYIWLKDQALVFLNPDHARYLTNVAERERRAKELESVLGTNLNSWRKERDETKTRRSS